MDIHFSRTFGLLLIASTLLVSGCDQAGAQADTAKEEEVAEVARIPVATSIASNASITSSYRTTALLEAREEADVVSKVNGIVEEILVEEGDYVEKGQLLARLRDAEYAISAAQTKADLDSIQAELKRMKNMAERELVSADSYDKLRFQADRLKAQHDMAQLNLTETRIVAPISGYISNRYVKTGNLVKQYEAQRLFHIVDQQQLQGIVHLPERELRQLSTGQRAQFTVSAYGDEVFTANVERISPVVDSQSGTFKVVMAINNSDQLLKPGMFAQLDIHYATRDDVIVIPRYAVISMDGEHHVFVVNGEGLVAKRDVELGFENDERIEIKAGLQAGDQLVITGQNNLKDQAPVEVILAQNLSETAL